MHHRTERVAEAVKEALSEIIQRELRDPRIPMIFTVREVRVTRDLQEARVYFSQLPDDEDAVDQTLDALEAAHGFLRSALGRRVRLRWTPDLKFFWDDSESRGRRVEQILSEIDIPPAEDEPKEEGEE